MKIRMSQYSLTLEEAFAEFILMKRAKGLSEKTLETYIYDFHYITKYLDREQPISGIRTKQIQECIARISDTGVSRNTVRHYSASLKSFFSWAKGEGMTAAVVPLYKGEETAPTIYSEAELKKLLVRPKRGCDFPQFRNWVIINLLVNNGIRASSVRGIQNRDVHLEDGVIYLRQTKRKKTIVVPLSASLVKILIEYMRIRKGKPEDFLFPNENGTQMSEAGLASAIERYNHSRGVRLCSIHAFRHTFARMYLVECGGDAIRLQRLLGHETLDMTKHYVRLFDKDLIEDFKSRAPLDLLQRQTIKMPGPK